MTIPLSQRLDVHAANAFEPASAQRRDQGAADETSCAGNNDKFLSICHAATLGKSCAGQCREPSIKHPPSYEERRGRRSIRGQEKGYHTSPFPSHFGAATLREESGGAVAATRSPFGFG